MYHLVGIDVILEMDWLFENHVIIDYRTKEVYQIREMGEADNYVFFRGEFAGCSPWIFSFVQTIKYLNQCCEDFLSSVVIKIED